MNTAVETCAHGIEKGGRYRCIECLKAPGKARKARIQKAKEEGRSPLRTVGEYTKRIQPARNSWKKIVIGFDEGFCAYHANVYGELVEATHGDHILPQGQNRKHVLDPWNGIACCDDCNRAHFDGLIKPTVRKVYPGIWKQTINGVWSRTVYQPEGDAAWWATEWIKD